MSEESCGHKARAEAYYSAFQRKEILPFVTWVDLGGIMLNEISQSEKGSYCMISLTCAIKKSPTSRNREQNGDCQGLGRGDQGAVGQRV